MFERMVEESVFRQTLEKSYVEKLLARKPIEDIRNIIRKRDITREETLELLYMISGEEIKLLNWSARERYVITKYFVWVQEFIKAVEIFYDFQEDYRKHQHLCLHCKLLHPKYKDASDVVRKSILTSTELGMVDYCQCGPNGLFLLNDDTTEKNIKNVERMLEHESKFLTMLYLNLGRSSLSQGGTAFIELLKNKFELTYPPQPLEQVPEKKGGLSRWFGG